MNGPLMFALLPVLVASAATPAPMQSVDKTTEAARIEAECGLKKGTIAVSGDEIRLKPAPDEAYEHVDCALARLKRAGLGTYGFVGNEMDPNAIVRPPLRYIAIGSSPEIASVRKVARTDGWVISNSARASEGTAIIELETSATMTNQQAMKLLNRIWSKEFGDIAFGDAPRKLSDPNPDD